LAGAVIAQTVVNYYYPQNGKIASASLALYLDSDLYPNRTAVDWEICEAGYTYTIQNMTVVNTGDVELNVSIVSSGLPADWKIEWQRNCTVIASGAKTEGWLNLTIPATAKDWPVWSFSLNGNA